MHRVHGLSHQRIDDLISEFETAAAVSLSSAIHSVAAAMSLTAAAGDPTEGPTPPVSLSLDDLGLIQSTWNAQVVQVLAPQLVAAFGESADHIAVGIGDALGLPGLPVVTPDLAEHRLSGAVNRMKNTGNVVWEQARNQLVDGLAAGEGIDEMSARLETVVGMSESDATRVARTEIIGAVNYGSQTMAEVSGLEMQKVWLATEDMRTRPSHTVADGQHVQVASTFNVGGYQLMFPGDPTGPADEIINCRCTQGYDIPDEQPDLVQTEQRALESAPTSAASAKTPTPRKRAPRKIATEAGNATTSVDTTMTIPVKVFSKSQAGRDAWLATDDVAARSATLWADTYDGMRAVRAAVTNLRAGREALSGVDLDGSQFIKLRSKNRGAQTYTRDDLGADVTRAAEWIRDEQAAARPSGLIFRGMRVNPAHPLQVGDEVAGDAVAWTPSSNVATRYANDNSGPNGEPGERESWRPVLVGGSGFHGADVGRHVVGRLAGQQPELVTSDSFVIDSIEEYDPKVHGHLFTSYSLDNNPLIVTVRPVP